MQQTFIENAKTKFDLCSNTSESLRETVLAYSRHRPGNGANGIRTHDLLHAMQALSQLSYGPKAG